MAVAKLLSCQGSRGVLEIYWYDFPLRSLSFLQSTDLLHKHIKQVFHLQVTWPFRSLAHIRFQRSSLIEASLLLL